MFFVCTPSSWENENSCNVLQTMISIYWAILFLCFFYFEIFFCQSLLILYFSVLWHWSLLHQMFLNLFFDRDDGNLKWSLYCCTSLSAKEFGSCSLSLVQNITFLIYLTASQIRISKRRVDIYFLNHE